jgi:predicted secreted protein
MIPFFMGCKEINLTIEDSGKTIQIAQGDVIHISLVSNKSTGNTWRKVNFDSSVLQEISDPVYKMDRENAIGAPGKVIYSFKAIKKGVSEIYMEYGSFTDLSKPPVKTFRLEVVVK